METQFREFTNKISNKFWILPKVDFVCSWDIAISEISHLASEFGCSERNTWILAKQNRFFWKFNQNIWHFRIFSIKSAKYFQRIASLLLANSNDWISALTNFYLSMINLLKCKHNIKPKPLNFLPLQSFFPPSNSFVKNTLTLVTITQHCRSQSKYFFMLPPNSKPLGRKNEHVLWYYNLVPSMSLHHTLITKQNECHCTHCENLPKVIHSKRLRLFVTSVGKICLR